MQGLDSLLDLSFYYTLHNGYCVKWKCETTPASTTPWKCEGSYSEQEWTTYEGKWTNRTACVSWRYPHFVQPHWNCCEPTSHAYQACVKQHWPGRIGLKDYTSMSWFSFNCRTELGKTTCQYECKRNTTSEYCNVVPKNEIKSCSSLSQTECGSKSWCTRTPWTTTPAGTKTACIDEQWHTRPDADCANAGAKPNCTPSCPAGFTRASDGKCISWNCWTPGKRGGMCVSRTGISSRKKTCESNWEESECTRNPSCKRESFTPSCYNTKTKNPNSLCKTLKTEASCNQHFEFKVHCWWWSSWGCSWLSIGVKLLPHSIMRWVSPNRLWYTDGGILGTELLTNYYRGIVNSTMSYEYELYWECQWGNPQESVGEYAIECIDKDGNRIDEKICKNTLGEKSCYTGQRKTSEWGECWVVPQDQHKPECFWADVFKDHDLSSPMTEEQREWILKYSMQTELYDDWSHLPKYCSEIESEQECKMASPTCGWDRGSMKQLRTVRCEDNNWKKISRELCDQNFRPMEARTCRSVSSLTPPSPPSSSPASMKEYKIANYYWWNIDFDHRCSLISNNDPTCNDWKFLWIDVGIDSRWDHVKSVGTPIKGIITIWVDWNKVYKDKDKKEFAPQWVYELAKYYWPNWYPDYHYIKVAAVWVFDWWVWTLK